MCPTPVSGFFRRFISPSFSKGKPKPAPVELTGYRSLKTESMLFTARLKQGQVQVADNVEGQAIARHLNREDKVYCVDGVNPPGGHTLRIKDARQDVFHLQSTPAVAAVLKSSRPSLSGSPGDPGRAHLGQVSGVQTTSDGQQFCLADGRLYRFEPRADTWLPDADAQPLSRIGLTDNGELLKVPPGIADRSRYGNTHVDLINKGAASALRINRGGEKMLAPVDESGRALTLTRVGLAGDVLYASNAYGELVCANVIDARDGKLRMVHHPLESAEGMLKGGISIEGFQHDDSGRLTALARDSRQQLHSVPLTGPTALMPEWNLSDVLVRGIEKGLPQPGLRALAGVIDLGQRGRVACEGERLLCWEPSGQRWEATQQAGIKRFEPGLDGRAYVVQDGQLKALATQQVRSPLYAGASHELAPIPAPRTQVVLDEVLAGDKQRRIVDFAVVDGRTFVTLGHDNSLKVQLDGRNIALRFSNPQPLQAVALDHAGNLYAQTRDCDLLTLDRQDWQDSTGKEASWKQVKPAKDGPLESLRMGSDKRLIASWGGLNYQLERTAAGAHEWQPQRAQATPVESVAQTIQGWQPSRQYKGMLLTSSQNVMGQTREGVHREHGFFKGLKAHFHPIDGARQIGLDIQHRLGGRQGLEGLYADDKQLHAKLEFLAHSKPPLLDIESQLDRLSGTGPQSELLNELKAALGQVEENSTSAARRLAEVHGYSVDQTARKAASKASAKSTLHQLHTAFKTASPSRKNSTEALLRSFAEQGMVLPAWAPDRKRDRSHPSSLIEGDLIHHAVTLKQLGELVTELEHTSGNPSGQAEIGLKLKALMQAYDQGPVHKMSTQQINNYVQAESLYNNFKLLAKDLGTEGSALQWQIAHVLGLPKNASIKEAMTRQVQELASGQSLTPKRTTGISVGGIVTGIAPVSPVEFFIGMTKSHANAVRISRTDDGARVEINMEDTLGAIAEAALGATIDIAPGNPGPKLRVAGEVTGIVARKKNATVSFNVKESDFPKMMGILTGEQGNVYDLLDLGTGHVSGDNVNTTADLHLTGRAQGRLQYNPLENNDRVSALLRSGIGPVASVNLAHKEWTQARTQGALGTSHAWGEDFQWLRQAGVSANVAPVNAVGIVNLGPDAASFIGYALPEVSVSRTLERGRSHTFSFSFKPPAAVTQGQVDQVVEDLSRYSPLFRKDVKALGLNQERISGQLEKLQRFLNAHTVENADAKHPQYQEICHAVGQLIHQQQWGENRLQQISSIDATVTRVGLKGDGLHSWLDDVAPANKAAIVRWFKEDPQFAQVLNDLEGGGGTSVSINLEVKPEVLRDIEASYVAGQSVKALVNDALSEPTNLRIKSMSLGCSASKSHGMALPSLSSLTFSSKAELSHSYNRVNVELEYGKDPDQPLKMLRNDVGGWSPPPPSMSIERSEQKVRAPARSQ